ncbi:MAG: hypothetical protein ACOC2C_03415 [Cyclonatronaceae bacterium]
MMASPSDLPAAFPAPEGALHLGIDGGGSGSRFVLYAPRHRQHYTFAGPPLQGREQSAAALAMAIKERIEQVLPRSHRAALRHIKAGIAGSSSGRDAITLELRSYFPDACIVVLTDAEACFAAHYPTPETRKQAALLMCGTGSVLVYEQAGQLCYRGGYGPAAFEACAGRQLGRDFLSALCLMHDTGEIPEAYNAFGCAPKRRAELLRLLYETSGSPASFAPACLALAEKGDPACLRITETHLSAALQLFAGCAFRARIGLYGGIMNASFLRKQLANRLQKSFTDSYIFFAQTDVSRFLSEQTASASGFIKQQ